MRKKFVAILFSLILITLISGCRGPMSCSGQFDCPDPAVVNFCDGANRLCAETEIYMCTGSGCVLGVDRISLPCVFCPFGCQIDECIPSDGEQNLSINQSDLIIENFSILGNAGNPYEEVRPYIVVRNVGTRLVISTTARFEVENPPLIIADVQVPALGPQQRILVGPVSLNVPARTSGIIIAKIDVFNQVDEGTFGETNNRERKTFFSY